MQSEAIAFSIVAIWPPVVPLVPAFPAGPADLDVITVARKQDCTSSADYYCFFFMLIKIAVYLTDYLTYIGIDHLNQNSFEIG